MNDLRVLFISGNWNLEGGRSSNYMTSLINSFENKLGHKIQAYNGGNVEDLPGILEEHVPESDLVFFSPNIPYSLSSKRRINPKDYNHRVTLVTFKRNDGKLSFDDMMSISITLRADLTCEVRKNADGRYEMRIYDILGNLWSDFTTNTAKSVATLVSRGTALKSLRYARFRGEEGTIRQTNPDVNEIVEAYKEFGHRLVDVVKPSEHVRRHLGEISFRGSDDPNDDAFTTFFASERNVRLSDDIGPENFVPTRMDRSSLVYFGQRKPHLNSAVFDRLFLELPDVNYIFSSQCYLRGARFTERILTKGCIQQTVEILKALEGLDPLELGGLNVLGQGSLILGRTVDDVEGRFGYLEKRDLPEPIGVEFDAILLDDGVETFDSILDGRKLEPGELLEIQFMDGSAGTYEIMVNSYRDDKNRPHHEAYIGLNVKGVPMDFPITGMLARRI